MLLPFNRGNTLLFVLGQAATVQTLDAATSRQVAVHSSSCAAAGLDSLLLSCEAGAALAAGWWHGLEGLS